MDVPVQLIADRVRRVTAPALESVARGEGKLVRHKGNLLAVYRDDAGCPHAVSPVCPHMGCHVQWNGAEKTWDCPCHGSRFGVEGDVVTGPATRGLEAQGVEERASKAPIVEESARGAH